MLVVYHASSLYSELVYGPAAHVPRREPRPYSDAPPHDTKKEKDKPCNKLEESDRGDWL